MTGRAEVAVHNLRVDDVTAQVLQAFAAANVSSVLLKGPSTVRWLYGERPRRYQDCDLLVAPDSLEAAERALAGLGFAPRIAQEWMPAWWREHAMEWKHRERYAAVDLHCTLKGVGVSDVRVWHVLAAETEGMPVGGFPAVVLRPPARALVLALDHLGDRVPRGDLELAVQRAGDEVWQDAARLAGDLDAVAAFGAGLRLAPGGSALAARLGLPRAASIESELKAALAPAPSLTVERLARASGLRERLGIVRQKLLPPRTFMEEWSPRARGGRRALLAAYGRRLAWVARSGPGAVRGWLRARRSVEDQRRAGD